VIETSKRRIERVAEALGIEGFARIDAFLSTSTGEILVIEANTIPGLTPSTVIFHQALQEKPALYPRDFLEKIVRFALQ
jgi:D-alanine-D-alanine ligase-like ATP-grasp enzyme